MFRISTIEIYKYLIISKLHPTHFDTTSLVVSIEFIGK